MSLKFLIILALSIFALTACSNSQNSTKAETLTSDSTSIINGELVKETDLYAKHTVSLGPAKGDQICTGVIIAPHFILTAGHCADGIKKGVIYFGLVATAKTATVYKIKNITRHPRYCRSCLMNDGLLTNANDLSLVEFEKDLPEGYEPVEFAPLEQVNRDITVYLAGYGADELQQYDTLKVTNVVVKQTSDTEFKTSETKSGSCDGDSGGPAFIEEDQKLVLAGITSRGDDDCHKHGIYTIPAAHAEWISEVTNPIIEE